MKVKCIKLKIDNESITNSDAEGFLEIGEEYYVSSILIDNYVYYDINVPISLIVSFPCEMFEVVSNTVPTIWKVKVYENGDILIGPELLFNEYFHDRYSDGYDYETIEYEKIRHLIEV